MAISLKTNIQVIYDEKPVVISDPLTPEQRGQCKWTRLDFLYPGDRFEIKGLESHFKGLYVVRVSECSVLVRGECNINEDEIFKPLSKGYCIACTTTVKRI